MSGRGRALPSQLSSYTSNLLLPPHVVPELTVLLHHPGGQKRWEGKGDQKDQGEISPY